MVKILPDEKGIKHLTKYIEYLNEHGVAIDIDREFTLRLKHEDKELTVKRDYLNTTLVSPRTNVDLVFRGDDFYDIYVSRGTITLEENFKVEKGYRDIRIRVDSDK